MIALLAVLLQADTTRRCVVEIDRAENSVIREAGDGQFDYFVSGGFAAHCRGQPGTNLRSDSAAYYTRIGQLDLVRRVRVEDPSLFLTTNALTYFLHHETYHAVGNVDALNRLTGTRVRGPRLEYLRPATGLRDTAEMYAPGRPTIDYVARGARTDTAPEPYVVVGDRVRMRGDDRIWAGGRVTVDRSDFSARGDSLWLDFTLGLGELLHRPSISTSGKDSLTLRGTRLELGLDQRDLKSIHAFGAGEATGSEFSLAGDTLALEFAGGTLERVFAWGDSSRPHVVAPSYDIVADSLALDLPGQRLTEARGFGQALARTTGTDTTRSEPDWLAGDSLYAYFGDQQSAPADSARPGSRVLLERAVARGTARALYLVYDKQDRTAPPGYSYSRGDAITIRLDRDGVRDVRVVGGTTTADGIYLRPALRDTTRRSP